MKMDDLLKWLNERVEDIEHDIQMDADMKEQYGKDRVPHGENNQEWLLKLQGKKDGLLDVIAHIGFDKMNKDLMLGMALED